MVTEDNVREYAFYVFFRFQKTPFFVVRPLAVGCVGITCVYIGYGIMALYKFCIIIVIIFNPRTNSVDMILREFKN